MASGLEIVFPVRSVFEMESANKAIQDMTSALSGKASNLKLDFGKIDPGESLVGKLGGYQQFFEAVRKGAQDVGKLATETTLMKNALTGDTIGVTTKEMYTLKGATGETSTTFKDFSKEAEIKIQKLKALGYVLEATSKEEANVARVQKMGNDAIRDAEKATIAATTAAEKYLSKSKNMGGQQVQTAKQAAQAVLDQAKAISTLDKTSQKYADGFAKLIQLQKSFGLALEGTKAGANVFQNFTNRITNAIQQTIAYSFSIGLVYKAQQLLNDAVKYAIDLNTEMTKIQVLQAEGAKTPEEINSLAQSFNKLGQEMGASTLEIAKGSVEWFRQGRTVDETQKLMKASMMLSKLGAMESADATNYLTSITNAFKISVEDTTSVVDKLIAVDNIAATSAGELATALRYTSESAALAGVEMEQLISYIGTVSTVTRQNAEMIGQAFKTMFARMTLIQGGGTDEEGWTISKVEKALTAVGVEMKEADGTFRNMGDVLEDTAAKWDTLGERERIEIAVAIGGVRQKEAFLVLMDNMDKALQYQAAQYDANGLAMDRYGIYMESIQAKQGKLTASMQELYASLINSNTISVFYDIAIGIVQTITQGKLLIPILGTILILMLDINKAKIKGTLLEWGTSSTILKSLIGLLTKFNIGMAATKAVSIATGASLTGFQGTLTVVAGGLGITVGALSTLATVLLAVAIPLAIIGGAWYIHKKQVEGATKAVNEFIDTQKELRQSNETAKVSAAAINELIAKREKGGTDWDAEGAKQLTDEFERLQKILPTLDWSWTDGRPFLTQKIDLEDLNNTLNNSVEITEKLNHSLYTYAKENLHNYEVSKISYQLNLEELRILTEAQKRYEAAGGGDLGAAAAQGYVNGLKKGMAELPFATQEAINSVNNIMVGTPLELPGTEDWEKRVEKRLQDVADATAKDKETVAKFKQMFLELISQGLDPVSGEMEGWLIRVFDKLGKLNPFKDLVQQARVAIINAQGEGSGDYWGRYAAAAKAAIEQTIASAKEANEDLKIQMELIDTIASGFNNIKNIDTSTAEGKAKLTKAVYAYQDAINGLDIKGVSVDFKYLYDAETKTWNIDGINTWVQSFARSREVIDKLKKDFPELATLLEDFATNSIASMNEVTTAAVSTTITIGNEVFTIGANQIQNFYNFAGEVMFAQAKASGIILRDVAGNVITSAGDVTIALAAEAENYAIFMGQLAASTAEMIAATLAALRQAGSYYSGKSPVAPVNPYIPSGGGGGGAPKKDPRAEALEKQIKAYEDQIELLQEQLEIYDEQIEAIDRLIEIENRKKEVIQDQIDIYEAQKDAIDRQIDVLQQQIDLLDRQVEMLNRQTAEIDRQIEMYQREISLIDREIEMYERQKALIDELIAAQEELIKPLEEQKDAIDKQLSSFKEAIDLQKEALQLRKEEADFLDELTKKNKTLANLEAEIAIASLDTSEEGIARRLKLEEEAAKAKEDLAKTQEDREYDLQVRGLDDAYAAFEKGMNAQKALLDDQIAKIQEIIDKYNTQKEAIDALIVPLEAEKLRIDDIIYGLEQQKIPIEDAIFRLEQEKIRIEDLIYPLEQQKIALDELIYPLTLQQEAIDLIIHQYEDEKRAIEDLKQPIEDNIELIGDKIEVLQDELDLINEITKAMGGGPGGGGMLSALEQLRLKMIENGIVGAFNDAAMQRMLDINIAKYGDLTKAIQVTIDQMKALITESNNARAAAEAAFNAGPLNPGPSGWTPPMGPAIIVPTTPPVTPPVTPPPPPRPPRHEGGFASEHGPDIFEGTLKESEIFAKLLKGEYVATEDQMKNFLRKTLPNMATEMNKMFSEEEKKLKSGGETKLAIESANKNGSSQPPSFNIEAIKIISPTQRSSGELTRPISPNPRENTYGDMNFEMTINVDGSLDKTVLPKLKKDVIKEINKSLERRGIRRTADSFAI